MMVIIRLRVSIRSVRLAIIRVVTWCSVLLIWSWSMLTVRSLNISWMHRHLILFIMDNMVDWDPLIVTSCVVIVLVHQSICHVAEGVHLVL